MKAIQALVVTLCVLASTKANAQLRVADAPNAGALLTAQSVAEKVAIDAPFAMTAAQECPERIAPSMLTSIHQRETDFCPGRPFKECPCSRKGACTPMQLMPETIRIFTKPGEDPQTLEGSMKIAARHLCFARGKGNVKLDPSSDAAILRYNASDEYLRDIRRIQATHEPVLASINSGNMPAFAQAVPFAPYTGPLTMTTAEGKTLTIARLRGGTAFPVGWEDCFISSIPEEDRSGGREHKGIDVACPAGTPVYAVQDGTVTVAGWNHATEAGERAGIHVRIQHNADTKAPGTLAFSGGMHLQSAAVRQGQRVTKGELIGYVGATAVYNSGAHLHFQLEEWETGGTAKLVANPMVFLNGSPYDPSADGMYKGPPAPARYAEKFRPLAQNP